MTSLEVTAYAFRPEKLFYIGLAIVMMALWIPFIPELLTFIHTWRVELFASVFLVITLSYLMISKRIELRCSADELKFIILPILTFICWSLVSILWANSWKSVIHHTSIWVLYLAFFLLVRNLIDRKDSYRPLIVTFTTVLLLHALPAVAGYISLLTFGGSNTLGIRFSRFGEQAEMLLPLVLTGALALKGKKFAIGAVAICGLWLLIFCSMSRASILLFVFGSICVAVLVLSLKRFRPYWPKLAVIGAAMAAATFLINGAAFFSLSETELPLVSRYSDADTLSNSNDFRKLMISLSTEMIVDKPLLGIGADNFGFEVNRYREAYSLENRDDPHLAQTESDIPERAHNEFLQIAAELGSVGAAIFAWFLFGIGLMVWRTFRGLKVLPLTAPAAVLGILLFLISSLVTSYSFRFLPNGLVFFFVLATASKFVFGRERSEQREEGVVFSGLRLRAACFGALLFCVILTIYSITRAESMALVAEADREVKIENATRLYRSAIALDGENAFAYNAFGMRLFHERGYADAIPELEKAIDLGCAPSASFSYLAAAQSLAGDNAAAERTMARAAVFYPFSVFVLAKYSDVLEQNGKAAEAEAIFERALALDHRAAITWRTLFSQGPHIVSKNIVTRSDHIPVMELKPENAMYASVRERLIKHPEEQVYSFAAIDPPSPSPDGAQ